MLAPEYLKTTQKKKLKWMDVIEIISNLALK